VFRWDEYLALSICRAADLSFHEATYNFALKTRYHGLYC